MNSFPCYARRSLVKSDNNACYGLTFEDAVYIQSFHSALISLPQRLTRQGHSPALRNSSQLMLDFVLPHIPTTAPGNRLRAEGS